MKQTEEEKEWIVSMVVDTMFPEEDLFRCSYLEGYIYGRLEGRLGQLQNLLSRQDGTLEEACQAAEITGQFREQLWSAFHQDPDIIWTEELVKAFLHTDISVEDLRLQADRGAKRVLNRILSEKNDPGEQCGGDRG